MDRSFTGVRVADGGQRGELLLCTVILLFVVFLCFAVLGPARGRRSTRGGLTALTDAEGTSRSGEATDRRVRTAHPSSYQPPEKTRGKHLTEAGVLPTSPLRGFADSWTCNEARTAWDRQQRGTSDSPIRAGGGAHNALVRRRVFVRFDTQGGPRAKGRGECEYADWSCV